MMADRSLARHVRENWIGVRGTMGGIESEESWEERMTGPACDENEDEEV